MYLKSVQLTDGVRGRVDGKNSVIVGSDDTEVPRNTGTGPE